MTLPAFRSRWAAIGAAVAVCLGAGGIGITQATTSSDEMPVYLPIEPCRLADTRPAPDTVGPRTAGLGPDEVYTLDGWGAVGNCNLPTGTAGLALNVTAVNPTAPTFLRLWPADGAQPTTSNLNPTPGEPPTPNAVNVGLSAAGKFSIFNRFGTVAVIVDVVGVYDNHNHDDRYYTKAQVDALPTLLFATVAPANATPVILRGSGATGVIRNTTGSYIVTFDRDVSGCTWVATYGQPDNSFVNDLWATVRGRTSPNDVGVVLRDDTGVQVDGDGFHLVVACP